MHTKLSADMTRTATCGGRASRLCHFERRPYGGVPYAAPPAIALWCALASQRISSPICIPKP
jgi:hypothetical protein